MTKTKWNLNSLSDFQDTVTEPYAMRPHRQRQPRKRQSGLVKFAVVVAVGATTAISLTCGVSNAIDYEVNGRAATTITQDGVAAKPPLQEVFSAKFGDKRLTAEIEKMLLAKLARSHGTLTHKQLIAQVAESIWFNQQEDVSSDATRLSRSEIEKIIRERKLI